MIIYLRRFVGEDIELEVEPSETIGSVKARVFNQEG